MVVVNFIPMIAVALLALLVLGGLATMVFIFVQAAVRKKPGAAWAVVLVPFALLLGVSVVGILSSLAIPTLHEWEHKTSIEQVDHDIAGDMSVEFAPVQIHSSRVGISFFGLILIVALVVGGLVAVKRLSGSHPPGEHGGGWLATGVLIAIVIMLYFAVRSWNWSRIDVARQQENVRNEVRSAQQQLEEVAQRVEEARANIGPAGQQSMQKLWDELNKPRIKMEADGRTATIEASVEGGPTAKVEATPEVRAEVAAVEEKSVEIAEPEEAAATNEEAADEKAAIESEPERQAAVAEESGRVVAATDSPKEEVRSADAAADEVAAKPRPAWVDDPPKRVGHVWREVVVAGEYATVEECYEAADDLLYLATWEHVQRLMGQEPSTPPEPVGLDNSAYQLAKARSAKGHSDRMALKYMGVGIDYIRRQIVPEDGEYLETVERSFGPMKKLYTQLEFTPSVDRELRERWEADERESRLVAVGTLGGLVVSLVGLAYGLLKVDTWTKGYYTKRLFLGVPAAIIGLIALAALSVAF